MRLIHSPYLTLPNIFPQSALQILNLAFALRGITDIIVFLIPRHDLTLPLFQG